MTKSKNLLLIFTRNPQLGQCKTRLAASIGDQNALDIYKFLLSHTQNITKGLGVDKWVCYSDYIGENDLWDSSNYTKKIQRGDDLGERMANAFKNGFEEGYEKIIVIGSDMYDLDEKEINAAFNSLDINDYVVGPALDGGYYLLGMKKFMPQLFKGKTWGTDTVLKNTLNHLRDEKYFLLSPKNDIDDYDDIKDIAVFTPFLKK
ncbi:Phosphoenolpyruvate guanylyltransferase [Arenibacter antarcticus]|uniref:TIGR04282 family arsenosugar biosynthesis glycosyltransferase n=1 Tax=Arenibacter antarcticus TaxID=2040469 RepID=A0ABW5VIJ2_9FLAO|nr:TIGR04282 family arsenosugar biosynthesis glycosyltransferase [Arenibacter sp. H213]MCM4166921.1 glycosyltransferase [Arenibacter sp. H213]